MARITGDMLLDFARHQLLTINALFTLANRAQSIFQRFIGYSPSAWI